MAKYILTGGATGIGAAIKAQLEACQQTVITLDIKDADYTVDLGDTPSRSEVVARVATDHPVIDGIVTCAGVASHFPDKAKILAINYTGTVDVVDGLRHCLGAGAHVVVISSNSAPQCSQPDLVSALLEGDEQRAATLADAASGHDCYSGSKQAVAKWMRSVAPEYARAGIAINAVAPGYIETPMTQAVAQSESYGDAIRQFVASIPAGRPGTPDDIANLVLFLLSDKASFIAGSVLFADGGHDAMFRPEAGL